MTLWLADKVFDVIKDEQNAIKALKIAEYKISKK